MFTGIVEATGRVVDIESAAGGSRIRVETPLAGALEPGASLAVNGVCLTVVTGDGRGVVFDVGPETVRITTLGLLQAGEAVNLERPMRVDGRLDGHFVQGHVDGMGTVTGVRTENESHWLTIGFAASLSPFVIPKGSVAVDGVSLTVARLGAEEFDVMIIPYTWTHTTLQHLRPGSRVNLECDMIGKYVARAMDARKP